MKKRNIIVLNALFLAGLCFSLVSPALHAADSGSKKPGLLILAHGSPSERWNSIIAGLTEKVEAANAASAADKKFHAITYAQMEFAKPDAATGIETLEKAGCDRIVVVPVFIFPTGHTHFDVPAVLGLYSSPSIRETLNEENARVASPKVPVTITQTLSEGTLLDRFVASEVEALSENPEEEAVLLYAHGDEDHAGLIEPIMCRLLVDACGGKKITSGKWTFAEVGQSYSRNVIPSIRNLAKGKKRVLVIGIYTASSAEFFSTIGTRRGRAGSTGSERSGQHAAAPANPLEGIDVKYSRNCVANHPETPNWVLQCAQDALEGVNQR